MATRARKELNEEESVRELLLEKAEIFESLGNPKRLSLLSIIFNSEQNEDACQPSVSTLAKQVDISISLTSRELKMLKRVGLVTHVRAGRSTRYITGEAVKLDFVQLILLEIRRLTKR